MMLLFVVLSFDLYVIPWNRLLKNCGCVCYEAEDGKECVKWMDAAAANGSPEVGLVLMDYEMPCKEEECGGYCITSTLLTIKHFSTSLFRIPQI